MGQLPIVRDHMDTRVYSLKPGAEILDAVGFLLEHHVTGAPVVDDAGHLVGMLTEKDCLRLVATGADAERPRGTVADFMTTAVTTISPDTDVYYAAGLFLHQAFRRLPVVEAGRLVGAITRFDILRVIHANLR
jgi:CBS domain-containing protein